MHAFRKTLILVTFFFLGFLFFGYWNYLNFGTVNNTHDFVFHWGQAKGIAKEDVYWQQLDREHTNFDYPPLYHFLAGPFTFHQLAFYAFNLFLIFVLIPLALFFVKKNFWIAATYLMGVSLAHQMLYAATYPLALVMLFLVIYLNFRKNWALLFILGGLSYLTHSYGLGLFLLIVVWEVFDAKLDFFRKISKKLRKYSVGWLTPQTLESPGALISVLLSQTPFPVFVYGIWGFVKMDMLYFVLGWASFFLSLDDLRALAVVQIVFCVTAGVAVSERPKKVKIGFAFFLLAQLAYYLVDFGLGTINFLSH